MPNEDISVKIVKTEAPLPVEVKNPVICVTAKETLPVEVLDLPKSDAGLPKPLRKGPIYLRTGKKSFSAYRVDDVHYDWAHLTPLHDSGSKEDDSAGWYYLPAIAAGPWCAGEPPHVKKGKDDSES